MTRLTDKFTMIQNLIDLEMAGVLAITGQLESVEYLKVRNIDVSMVPSNILQSLAKIAGVLVYRNVIGFKVSMLENLSCEILGLTDVTIPEQVLPEISVEDIVVYRISGNLSRLLDSIACERLSIDFGQKMTLGHEESMSLRRMLDARVRQITISSETFDFSFLAYYEGEGCCEEIIICFRYGITNMKENDNFFALWANSRGWNATRDDKYNHRYILKRE